MSLEVNLAIACGIAVTGTIHGAIGWMLGYVIYRIFREVIL